MIKKYVFLILSCLLLSIQFCCKNHKKKVEIYCEDYNKLFVEFELVNRPDSALVYINKAIKCNPTEDFYKFSKVNFLNRQSNYIEAARLLKTLDYENELSLQLMVIALDMKTGRDSIDSKLNKIYTKINYHKFKVDASTIIYKIALDNYFKGGQYALNEIKEAKLDIKDYNSTLLLESIKQNIESGSSKQEIIYKLFNFE